jgi:hypothetical protein
MLFHRKVPWYISVPLLAATAVSVGAARWPGPVLPCETAAAWVADHHAELPSTLAGLNMYSPAYRTAIFRALPIGAQEQLWTQQLEAFITPRAARTILQRDIVERASAGSLTAHQVAIIRRELTRLPVYFDSTRSLSDRQLAVRSAVPMIDGAFTPPTARAIFGTLGLIESLPVAKAPSASVALHAGLLGAFSKAVRTNACTCNSIDDMCCALGAQDCSWQPSGCGPFMTDPCDGVVQQCIAPVVRKTRSDSTQSDTTHSR